MLRLTGIVLVALTAVVAVGCSPGTQVGAAGSSGATGNAEADPAREKFEKLKSKLDTAIGPAGAEYAKQQNSSVTSVLRHTVSATGPMGAAEAKVTITVNVEIQLTGSKNMLSRTRKCLVYLKYHDGAWVTTRYEGTWDQRSDGEANGFAIDVMKAIDEAAKK